MSRANVYGDAVSPGDRGYSTADDIAPVSDRLREERRTVAMDSSPLVVTGINPMLAPAYHADRSAWSRSMIADFRDRRSICHARHILGTAPEQKVTKVMELGDLAHAALLEPHRLGTDYIAYPEDLLSDGAVRSKAAKDFRDDHQAAGRVVLKDKDFATVAEMVASVQRSQVGTWLNAPGAKIEHAVYWIDQGSGLTCRCRPDVLIVRDLAYCLDVKTTADVSPLAFRKRIEDGGLLLQDSHYSDGVRTVTGKEVRFLFVAVETTWPYTCAVYEIEPGQRSTGWAQRRTTMLEISSCLNTGVWLDQWENEINKVTLRPWALGNSN